MTTQELVRRLVTAAGLLFLMCVVVIALVHVPLLQWHMSGALIWLLVMSIVLQVCDDELYGGLP